jgi:hypothetical protein
MHALKRQPTAAPEHWEGDEAQLWKPFSNHDSLFADSFFAAANFFL